MASLRIFVSSTCYDLSTIRGQIRATISSMGYEPIMSDYNDVLYDPRIHTHTSCIDEIATCDMIILIVGSRFGGKAIPEAISQIDFDAILDKSKSVDSINKKENISVTQLEILKAVEIGIPIFTFVDNRLWNDHALYEKNKDKKILNEIEFPSIDKPETAPFIFEFINFLRHRTRGNSINTFTRYEEIEVALKKQWSGLLQRLLYESRNRQLERKRIDSLTNQFEDLKTAILTSIGNSNEKEIARGVVRFRRLIDFLRSLRLADYSILLNESPTWDEFLNSVGIIKIIDVPNDNHGPFRSRSILVKEDQSFYEVRYPAEWIHELSLEFEAFVKLNPDTRNVIFDALSDMRMNGLMRVRFRKENIEDYLQELNNEFITQSSIFGETEENESE